MLDVFRPTRGQALVAAGFSIQELRENPYEFISDRACDASVK
jgi:hypothetical protein